MRFVQTFGWVGSQRTPLVSVYCDCLSIKHNCESFSNYRIVKLKNTRRGSMDLQRILIDHLASPQQLSVDKAIIIALTEILEC